MNVPLKQAILAKMDDCNFDEMQAVIVDAIEEGEESTLPGLGVLFETLWASSNETEKQDYVSKICSAFKSQPM